MAKKKAVKKAKKAVKKPARKKKVDNGPPLGMQRVKLPNGRYEYR